jgi:hypothetical protein
MHHVTFEDVESEMRPDDTGGYGWPPGTPAFCGEVSAIVSCSCEVLVKPEGL